MVGINRERKRTSSLDRVVIAGKLLNDIAVFCILQFNNDKATRWLGSENVTELTIDGKLTANGF